MTNTSSGFADHVLRELRCAHLRAKLMVNEIQFAGFALKAGLIDPAAAIEHLAEVGVLGLITTPSSVATWITKHDVENIERAVLSMSQNQYWGLLGWLSNACEGDLWDCVKPRHLCRRPNEEERHGAAG